MKLFNFVVPRRRSLLPLAAMETMETRELLTGAIYPLPAAADDFNGTWVDNAYQFDLEQKGGKVSGRVHQLPLGGFSDDIKGKADDNNLTMTFKFPVTVSSPDGVLKYKIKATLGVARTGETFSGLLTQVSKKGNVDSTTLIDATRS